jgi:serine/threonine-protein kinase
VSLVEQSVLTREQPELGLLGFLGNAYAMAGRMDDAREVLIRMQQMKDEEPAHHLWFAEIHAALGEVEEAFARLDKAVAAHEAWLPNLRFEPGLVHIRDDPRFAEVHRKIGLGHVDLSEFQAGDPHAVPRVAVLPFENTSGDAEFDYLAREIPASVIDGLSLLSGLQVVPRSQSFALADHRDDLIALGAELDADYLLMGDVHTRGDELRLRAELIEVAPQSQAWSERFDRSLDDSLAVEREITDLITGALQLEIAGEESERLTDRRPANSAAYKAFLEGRFWRNKETDIQRAIDAFERAIDEDPTFAAAYARLAEAHWHSATWGITAPAIARQRGEAALRSAEAIDPDDVTTIVQRAAMEMVFDWDWRATERRLLRAIELDPEHASAHHMYGHLLALLGRHSEAVGEFERAVELEPLSPPHLECLGSQYIKLEAYDDAERVLKQALNWDPTFAPASFYLAWLAERSGGAGGVERALEYAAKAVEDSGRRSSSVSLLGYYAALSGNEGRARELLQELLDRRSESSESFVAESEIARIHVGLGQFDMALDLLELACENREPYLSGYLIEVGFEPLRGNPRFDAIFRRMELDPPRVLTEQAQRP